MTDPLSASLFGLSAAARAGDAAAFACAVQGLAPLLAAQRQNARAIGPKLAFGVLKPAGMAVGQALSEAPDHAALACLKLLAEHDAPELRCIACYAFAVVAVAWPATRLPAFVPIAHDLAKDESWEVREFIANAFDEVVAAAHPEAVYTLMQEWVHDADANVRRVPTNALMRYGRRQPHAVIDLMHELLHDESSYVRDNVVFCLGVMGAARVAALGGPALPERPRLLLATLRSWLSDDDERARWIIAKTLGRTWARPVLPEALELLGELESDERRKVRSAALSSRSALLKESH